MIIYDHSNFLGFFFQVGKVTRRRKHFFDNERQQKRLWRMTVAVIGQAFARAVWGLATAATAATARFKR